MTVSLITITVIIDAHGYTTDVVGDPDDVMFAVAAGRAVSDTIVTHTRKIRDQEEKP